MAFLAVGALSREPVKSEEPSRWGFAFLLPALFLVSIDSAIHTELLSAFGLLLALPGISLLLLGVRRTRALAFPLFLAFFMLPIPGAFLARLHLLLREITTLGTGWTLYQLGVPVFAEGTTITLAVGSLRVVEECSGFSALYAGVTVALVLAYLSRSWPRRVLVVTASVLLALVCNVMRITVLALLVVWFGFEVLETRAHVLSGYASFVLTLLPLFALAERRRD